MNEIAYVRVRCLKS